MNVQLPVRLDKQAFLAWVQGREERYELAKGRVIMTVGASRAHAILLLNLAGALRARLNAGEWTVLAEFGVDAEPETLRYPDIVVDRARGNAKDYTATEPVLIAEVLSPSTTDIDLGDKAAEYLRLPSLVAYLVFSQSEEKAWVWVRGDGSFSPGPTVFSGETAIEVAALNLQLPLADIYAGVPKAET